MIPALSRSSPSWARGGVASSSRPTPVLSSSRARPRARVPSSLDGKGSSGFLQFPGEYSFNLDEYMVLLEKPVGLTLAPEPHTGRILVQRVHDGSPAASSRLIQVGDWLKACSAVFGEEMWECTDVQRTRWAISNRAGKVKLVFERGSGGEPPIWYYTGKLGLASSDVAEGQCILRFDEDGQGAAVDACATDRGNCLFVAFNRCSDTSAKPPPSLPAGKRARFARADEVRQQLAEAAAAPELLLAPPAPPLGPGGRPGGGAAAPLRLQMGGANVPLPVASQNGAVPFRRSVTPAPGSGSSSSAGGPPAGWRSADTPVVPSSGGAAAAAGAAAAGSKPPKRVLLALPWLMLTSSRLTASDLTRLASQRALGALLEYEVAFDQDGAVSLRRTSVGGGHAAAAAGAAGVPGGGAAPAAAAVVAVAPADVGPSSSGGAGAVLSSDGDGAAALGSGMAVGIVSSSSSSSSVEVPAAAGSVEGSSSSSSGGPNNGGISSVTVGGYATKESSTPVLVAATSTAGAPGGGLPVPSWPTAGSGGSPVTAATSAAESARARAAAPAVAEEPDTLSSAADPAAAALRTAVDGLIASTAQLQRLSVRRRAGRVRTGDTHLLLHYPEGSEAGVSTLLAAWLHWHQGLGLDEAVAAASAAMTAPAIAELITAASDRLVTLARAHFSRIVLVWPYGGMSADVSGELVGGWGERVPMRRCMSPAGCRGAARGQFLVELTGLRPGRYHYKFIIDNTWAVDPFAPKDLDDSGNWNNVCEVRPPPQIESESERAHFAALEAAVLAFEAKMGTGSGVRRGI